VDWEVWEPDPHWDFLGDLQFRIEARMPMIQIEALRAHKIRFVLEDQVSVGF
jgi:hypothetical protein